MSILRKIVEQKKERVSSAKSASPLAELKKRIKSTPAPLNFSKAVKRDDSPLRLIAEIKKASPSKGLIRSDFNHTAIASIYEAKKVDAISVLTEEDFFQGSLKILEDVRKIVSCPILRKDFIFDEYQVYEARATNADAILLISAILDLKQAEEYLHLSFELGLSVLFEVHNFDELEKALRINAPIIGINNRDLRTLSIDLATSTRLKLEIPPDKVVVSESGIRKREDVEKIASVGIDAILVGTCLMESSDIGLKIDELRGY